MSSTNNSAGSGLSFEDATKIVLAIASVESKLDNVAQRLGDLDRRSIMADERAESNQLRINERLEEISRRAAITDTTLAHLEKATSEANRLRTEAEKLLADKIAAAEKRAKLHDSELAARIDALEQKARTHDAAITHISPSAQWVYKVQERFWGVVLGLSMTGVLVGAALATFKEGFLMHLLSLLPK